MPQAEAEARVRHIKFEAYYAAHDKAFPRRDFTRHDPPFIAKIKAQHKLLVQLERAYKAS